MRKKVISPVLIILLILLLLSMAISAFLSRVSKHDKEEIQLFENHKAEFELVNNYIIENFVNKPGTEENIQIVRQSIEITGFYNDGDVRIDNSVRKALNSLDNCFKGYDFSFIEITDERISYGGLGYRMYVYSENGKVPTYFYHDGDGMHPEVYELGDNWYLLKVNFR